MSLPRVRGALLAVVLLLLLRAAPAAAQGTPEREPAFIYATTYYDGQVYGSAFMPPAGDTLYLLSERPNVLSPRDTLVYFWPITNRYVADWDAKNEVVEGELEILRQGNVTRTVRLQEYVVQYDSNSPYETLQLHVGEDAQPMYEQYETLRLEYQHNLFNYHRDYREWRNERDRIIASTEPGELDEENLPDPPVEPRRFSLQSSIPSRGFVVDLEPGRYEIRLRLEDGSILPESRKNLVIFSAQRQAISYDVIPERRWTRPEASNEPDSVVYALPGTVLYLQPHREREYNELYHSRMEDPQFHAARADRVTWVRYEPYYSPAMVVRQSNESQQEVPLEKYAVMQISGSTLGYEVIPLEEGERHETAFEGYKIEFTGEQVAYSVHMVDESGDLVPGSERRLRVLHTDRTLWVYVLSGLPFLAGLGVYAARRSRTRTVDVPNA